jgi:hypothetical protein
MFENLMFAAICWLCSLVFFAIAFWAFKRKDPMHFWSGTTVRPEEITDIPAYNRANGLMWAVYAASMALTGIISLFSVKIGTILLMLISVPGIVVLILVYNRIYKKYRITSLVVCKNNAKSSLPKAVKVIIILINAAIIIAVILMFYYSEKEPEINIFDNHIQITGIYGLNIDLNEIYEISLIDKSMSDIGIGKRYNGYSGFGGTLKGNFKSGELGNKLLFVESKSSPTIKIERIANKDVYISFSNSEKTKRMFSELTSRIQ